MIESIYKEKGCPYHCEHPVDLFMWFSNGGLCDKCKKNSKEHGFMDSFCRDCHKKYQLLRYFFNSINAGKGEGND